MGAFAFGESDEMGSGTTAEVEGSLLFLLLVDLI